MAREVTNIAASVRARLQNIAKQKKANFQRMLTRYALERLLFRLSVSPHKDRFVLKGAMLYAAWLNDPFRTTRDLDLLSFGDREAERLVGIFRDICVQAVEDDGLSFDAEHIVADPIRDDQTYGGLRIRTSASLGTAVIPIQIDIGFGDAVTPGPSELEYPVLLDLPAPKLNAYSRETVAAEKFEAMVTLDLANSRMKDFYDLLAMSRLFTFDGKDLAAAIRATFERRATPVPRERPPSLTGAFADEPQKVQQWRSFLAREPLLIDEPDLPTVIREIGDFIMPAAHGAIDNGHMPGGWTPGSGWRSAT
ncbi:nucleotidyl transferase AbiEii/AbiGii toxin family protein [Tistrella mobilis]|uniref:nucleotidyl transferase AbiEii/AbiGii toxin family protein n=1 Tax=Tistrella mobilis TaxID=171437 RepID=UPI003555F444